MSITNLVRNLDQWLGPDIADRPSLFGDDEATNNLTSTFLDVGVFFLQRLGSSPLSPRTFRSGQYESSQIGRGNN